MAFRALYIGKDEMSLTAPIWYRLPWVNQHLSAYFLPRQMVPMNYNGSSSSSLLSRPEGHSFFIFSSLIMVQMTLDRMLIEFQIKAPCVFYPRSGRS